MRIAWPVMIIVPALMSASLCAALLRLPTSTAAAAEMPVGEALKARVRAADQALKKAQGDLDERRNSGSMSETDAADYRSYIRGLHEHLAAECAALLGAGVASPPEVACEQLVSSAPRSGQAGPPAATDAEHTEALDARLNRSIGEFDDLLLRERERVKAARPLPSEAGTGSSAGAGQASAAAQASAGTQAGAATKMGAGTKAGEDTQTGPGPSAASTGGRVGSVPKANTGVAAKGKAGAPRVEPDSIPSGNDDDVVARQLREAAQQESDPELQKKLWEEYRRYKRGTN